MESGIAPGTAFGTYRVESLLGRGGMGVVYRATDLSLERPVALKLIAPELAEDESFRERFLREPRLAASLDHPNVIPIYEAGEHEGQLYLAMRYVEGSDLRTLLERDGKLAPERTLAILAQVAGALDAAHRRGLVHRDVKPANVLLDEDDHAYLTDFGITKQAGRRLDGHRPDRRDARLPGARADPRRGGRRPHRRLRARVRALRVPRGHAAVPARDEAETMWAHMQEEPPRCAASRRSIRYSKRRWRRSGTSATRAAPRSSTPRPTRSAWRRRAPLSPVRRRGAVRRRRRLLVGRRTPPPGRGGRRRLIAAWETTPSTSRRRRGTASRRSRAAARGSPRSPRRPRAPSSLAVGEGSLWALGLEDKTVLRVDPDARRGREAVQARRQRSRRTSPRARAPSGSEG